MRCRFACNPCLGGPAKCWCPPFYPTKVLCWLVGVAVLLLVLYYMLDIMLKVQLGC